MGQLDYLNKNGRPKGAKNKTTKELKLVCKEIFSNREYLESVKARIYDGTAPHVETFFLQHWYGKPKEKLEISGGGSLFQFNTVAVTIGESEARSYQHSVPVHREGLPGRLVGGDEEEGQGRGGLAPESRQDEVDIEFHHSEDVSAE